MTSGNYPTEVSDDFGIADTEPDEQNASEPTRFEISSYPTDYTVEILANKLQRGSVRLPDFQRGYVWDINRASKLVESFLLGLPVPQIFLYKEQASSSLLIVDGHQRLESLRRFYSGTFGERVFRLKNVQSRWDGRTYDELEDADRLTLDNTALRALVIQQLSPEDNQSVFLVFERLNSGGVTLTPMEIRKSIFHGALMERLQDLNLDVNWRALIGKPEADPRLRDVELLVRVLALATRRKHYAKPMKSFLTDTMGILRRTDDGALGRLSDAFRRASKLAVEVLGPVPFHLRGRLNLAVLDSFLGVLVQLNGNVAPEKLSTCYSTLVLDEAYLAAVSLSTSDQVVVSARFTAVANCLQAPGVDEMTDGDSPSE